MSTSAPRLRGVLVTDLVEARRGDDFERAAPGVPRIVLARDGVIGSLDDVEAAFASEDTYPDRFPEFARAIGGSPNLRWVQTFTAGVDHPWFDTLRQRDVRITTSSGVASAAIAQTVAMFILGLSRRWPTWTDAQRAKSWAPHDIEDLEGQVLGVLGLGPVGTDVARLGHALGMRVVGMRRTPDGTEPCEAWSFDRLTELLGIADYLVLALPLTETTHHLLDKAALDKVKAGVRIVNVGRGALVDEPALVDALRDGRVGGAALDVFEEEPLPEDSPLWDLPGVIVTPHACGRIPGKDARTESMFIENVGRYLRGEPLRNEVP